MRNAESLSTGEIYKSLSAKHPQHSTTPPMLQAENYSLACLVCVDMEKDN
jgi:hypothetical protein